ncbi:MAG: hypothetical protein ACOZAO_01185 [Patescibacteria group bacterium]
MTKVKFIVDTNYDAMTTWNMLNMEDPAGLESRLDSMGIQKKDADKFVQAEAFEEIEEWATNFLEEQHAKHSAQISSALKGYQQEWDKINDHFFEKTTELTSHKWTHKEYKVVISPLNKGVSNMCGDTVVRSALEDSKDQLRITAHELLMHHMWHVIWELFPDSEENPVFEYWALNELVTNAVLGLDPDFKDLWSKKTQGYDQYLKNYPQLEKVKLAIKSEYVDAKGIKDFVSLTLEKVRS